MSKRLKHRGRFQAQGGGLEESESWSQEEPFNKKDALELLGKLKSKLSDKELKKREKAFRSAESYIKNATGGIDAVKKKSFYDDKKNRSIRVDIEILGGKAFLAIIFLLILLGFLKTL